MIAWLQPEQRSGFAQAAVSHACQRGQVILHKGNRGLAVLCVPSIEPGGLIPDGTTAGFRMPSLTSFVSAHFVW